MADSPRYRRDKVTGRFARRPVPGIDAESAFNPIADSIERIDNVSAADIRPGMEIPRHVPEADELAQGGQASPLRARNPELVHPDDAGFHNGISRTAARCAGTMDPSAYLTGLEPSTPATSAAAEDSDGGGDRPGPVMRPAGQGAGRGRFR